MHMQHHEHPYAHTVSSLRVARLDARWSGRSPSTIPQLLRLCCSQLVSDVTSVRPIRRVATTHVHLNLPAPIWSTCTSSRGTNNHPHACLQHTLLLHSTHLHAYASAHTRSSRE